MNTACQAARSECELLFSVWEALPNLAPIILAISAIIAFGIYRQNQHQGRLNNKHAKERVQIARSFDHIVEQTKDRDLLLANEQFKALIEALKEKHSGPYGYEEVENTFVNFRGQAVYGSEILIRLFNYYEATAIGIELGALNESIIREWWRGSYVQDWIDFRRYVHEKREARGTPALYVKYENQVRHWATEAERPLI